MPRRDPRTFARAIAALAAVLLVLTLDGAAAAVANAPARPCRTGSIALTFDDGPTPTMTPRLVRVLRRENVPATFFMVGAKARKFPGVVRLVDRSGFTIGNHTWSHRELTRLSNREVRGQVLRAGAELRRQGIDTGALMRPPYGAINGRVSREIRALGLVPVLWTADSRDWESGTARQIADRILAQLRPYRKNIVLQHDGVENSAASIAAVVLVVRTARARGYCFTDLGPRGGVARFGSVVRPHTPAADPVESQAAPAPAPAASSPIADPGPSPLLDLIARVRPPESRIAAPLWSALRLAPAR